MSPRLAHAVPRKMFTIIASLGLVLACGDTTTERAAKVTSALSANVLVTGISPLQAGNYTQSESSSVLVYQSGTQYALTALNEYAPTGSPPSILQVTQAPVSNIVSWTAQGHITGSTGICGDPWLATDGASPNSHVYLISIGASGSGNCSTTGDELVLWYSSSGGVTGSWLPAYESASSLGCVTFDKPSVAVSSDGNTAVVAYICITSGGAHQVQAAVVTNQGLNWSASTMNPPSGNNVFTNPIVRRDCCNNNNYYMTYQYWPTLGSSCPTHIGFANSTNGGSSFSYASDAGSRACENTKFGAATPSGNYSGSIRNDFKDIWSSFYVEPATDYCDVVWEDNGIIHYQSTPNGQNWGGTTIAPVAGSNLNYFQPQITVAPAAGPINPGAIAVTWYAQSTTGTLKTSVYGAISTNTGQNASFGSPQTLTSGLWTPFVPCATPTTGYQPNYFGDYTGLVAVSSGQSASFFATWADSRAGTCQSDTNWTWSTSMTPQAYQNAVGVQFP